ncbi:PIN domain-containing protein [Streptomyces nigra]|uniref:PIN domain-containing protein n=1 Tax=Streptomyces nigra TaxID=1827580 RepID=UPI0035E04B31
MSTFLKGFDGLWARPIEDYREAVRNYLIVLDTNVLLELYRFTPQARHELLDILNQLGDRLWVPHQVVSEYHNRRFDAVREHLKLYTSVPESLKTLRNKALQEVQALAKRSSMNEADRKSLVDPISEAFDRVTAEIARHAKSFDLSLTKVVHNDPVLAMLAQILDGKTGEAFRDEEINSLLESFQERASEQIPPGYKDAGKPENAHGDYFVWEQLLREAAERNVPVLLVTNDAKEDWVQKEAGFVVGARPELLTEFANRCGGDFLITQLPHFLGMAKEVLGASVSQSTLQQAKNVRDADVGPAVQITLPRSHYHAVMRAIIAEREEAMDIANSVGDDASAEETDHITSLLLEAIKRTGRQQAGGDVSFVVPTEHYPAFTDFLRTAQTRGQIDENLVIERTKTSSESRRLMRELAELQEALERAKRELELARANAMMGEKAMREADPDAPSDERDRLSIEATESKHRLNSTAHSVHSLEEQIATLSRQLNLGRM